jgi:hypothetical protein
MVIRNLVVFAAHSRLLHDCIRNAHAPLNDEELRKISRHYKTCVLSVFRLSENVRELPPYLENTTTDIRSLISRVLNSVPLSLEEQGQYKEVLSRPSVSSLYRKARTQISNRCDDCIKANRHNIKIRCRDWIYESDRLLAELEKHYRTESFRGVVRSIYHLLKDLHTHATKREFKPRPVILDDESKGEMSRFVVSYSVGLFLAVLYICRSLLLSF